MENRKNNKDAEMRVDDSVADRLRKDTVVYQVQIQDEYDNLYLLGFYPSLDDAVDDINDFIDVYPGAIPLKKGDLAEYVSTFGSCFDHEIEWENEEDCPGSVMVRGFALSAEAVAEDLAAILSAPKDTEE